MEICSKRNLLPLCFIRVTLRAWQVKIIDFVRHRREMMALEVLSSPRHEIFLQFYLAELPPVISWIGLRAARGGIGALCCFIGFFGKVIWSRFDSRVGTWVGRSLQDFTILLWNMLCALENWRSCQTIPIPIWLHGCWFPSSRHGRRNTKAFLQGLCSVLAMSGGSACFNVQGRATKTLLSSVTNKVWLCGDKFGEICVCVSPMQAKNTQ